MKVAVIGAGPSGLIAARELQRHGHLPVIYEKSSRIGGTWVYDPRVESDPLSVEPNREVIHGSLYRSLRTNLPRPLMGFSDYTMTGKDFGDPRNFPGHEEVLKFLESFVDEFGLIELIRFNEEVIRVEQMELGSSDEWIVNSRTKGTGSESVFDAVVMCSGHFTEPIVAEVPGIGEWIRKQIHSHNYRDPEPFRDEIVVMIGSSASALDISREVASVAKEVHLSSRSTDLQVSKLKNNHNIWQHPKIEHVNEDGTVIFHDGSSVQADTIFYCTGYKYDFSFLKMNQIVTVEDNRVGPLYKHVFPPQLAPRLSFVGMAQKTVIFATLELQAKWIAHVLSGKVFLPSKEEMLSDVEELYKFMDKSGIPKHHTHFLHPFEFEYMDWVAEQIGLLPFEEELKAMYWHYRNCLYLKQLDTYRDEDYPASVNS